MIPMIPTFSTLARREADWDHYLKSPGLNCNAWPTVTMYDYSFELQPGKTAGPRVEACGIR